MPGQAGELNWRLSAHPITLLTYLSFRIGGPLVYILGAWFIKNFVLVFIITLLLLSIDFYYLKNIAGRRLVGLRWWNEVNTASGESHWVFESRHDATYHNAANSLSSSDQEQNTTDHRFFWLSLYIAPALWIALAIVAMFRVEVIWLSLVVIALVLTITNTVAFSRCDKFGQASRMANSALQGSGFARGLVGNITSNLVGRFFR